MRRMVLKWENWENSFSVKQLATFGSNLPSYTKTTKKKGT
jgi:hypothetical protein